MSKILRKKILSILFGFIFTAVFLSGCGSVQSKDSSSKVTGNSVYPLTITDTYKRKVTIDKKPTTIVSLAPNITEIVYALNASDRLKGRTDYCDYPKSVSSVPSVGNITDPSVEKIVELKPDVVIASNLTKKDIIDKLEKLNIKVVALHGSEDLEGAYDTIEKVGQILDENNNANKIVSDMKNKVDNIENKVKAAKKPKVYYVVSYGQYGDYTGGKGTYVDKMILAAGGNNIAEDAEGWKYSLEKVVEHDPEIIVCSKYFDTKAGLINANGYRDLSAVKSGKVFEIDNNLLDRQGPRMADGLEALAKIIHPELFK
ncbi:MAG: ABC transporter substrate-binding protein [Bacillota bacterium]|nr:ABC transporter substrate-binding protein [Bacillota bacterium]